MNNLKIHNSSNYLSPHNTFTIYSCKKTAWLLFNALKQITPNPTFKTLLEISSYYPDIMEKSPVDVLYYIYPYLSLCIDYNQLVKNFISAKNIDIEKEIKLNNILQFLAFCDGYSSWESMRHHLSNFDRNLLSFSFVLNKSTDYLDVYTYFDNETHPNHGKKLKAQVLQFPEYDKRKLWGRPLPQDNLHILIAELLQFINPHILNDIELIFKHMNYLYKYFRDIEQVNNELLLTELDLLQIIEFETIKEQEPPDDVDPEWLKAREEGSKALLREFLSDAKIDNSLH